MFSYLLAWKFGLGAVGALMVFLEGISGATLFALQNQPQLQKYIVFMMIGTIGAITITILSIIIKFAFTRPGLLFNPQDIDPSAHVLLYGGGEPAASQPANAQVEIYRASGSEEAAPSRSVEST
ncbi:MAG: hypothetical protein HY681_13210 [Chloroflexi bacterium]|nr:hypothetical protein [Chloroflexota bacterium]